MTELHFYIWGMFVVFVVWGVLIHAPFHFLGNKPEKQSTGGKRYEEIIVSESKGGGEKRKKRDKN